MSDLFGLLNKTGSTGNSRFRNDQANAAQVMRNSGSSAPVRSAPPTIQREAPVPSAAPSQRSSDGIDWQSIRALPAMSIGQEPAGSANINSFPKGQLGAFLQAISTQESGGNYGAVGVPTKYGTAYGKYQILDSNIEGPGGWDAEALNRDISVQEFLNSPKLQESIARTKLSEYFKSYGPGGAAKAWYAGPGNADSTSTAPQYGGPSITEYANSVLRHMQNYM